MMVLRNSILARTALVTLAAAGACAGLAGCSSASGESSTGPTGDGGGGGNPSLCSSSYLFCDGFEDGLQKWSQTFAQGGTATVDSTHVFRGGNALHAHVDPVAAGASAYADVQRIDSWPNHVFTRIFVYQPSPHPPTAAAVMDMLQANMPYQGIELLTDPPSGTIGMKTYSTAQDQVWKSSGASIAMNKWDCFELEVDVSAGTSHLYMNDSEVTDVAKSNLGLPQLGILGVGLSFYMSTAQGAQDVWIDEVAVNTSRIGCKY